MLTGFLSGVLSLLSMQGPQLPQTGPREAQAVSGSALRPEDYRVASVGYRLASRGLAFCQHRALSSGLLLHQLAQYPLESRAEADRQYGLASAPGVLLVIEDSPAARAGLRAGDLVLKVNGKSFPSPSIAAAETNEKARRKLVEASEALLEDQLQAGQVTLTISRGGNRSEVRLVPERVCYGRARLARSKQANAFADGNYAVITTKLLDFVRSDDELAVVVAHEMAHNILGHPAELERKGVPTGIARNFGKNASRVLRTEEEADRLGIKLMWAAGYDVSAALPFWRRLYAKYDPIPTPKLFRTHPTLGGRERIIEETVAELRASGSQPSAKRP